MSIPSRTTQTVVAFDGSEESIGALKWALGSVGISPEGVQNSILILHVQPNPSLAVGINPGSMFGGPSMEVPAFVTAVEAHQAQVTDSILNRALQICADTNVNLNVKTQVVIGDPKQKICQVVENLHADLLVMGTRDFGRFKRFLLGSVSKYCMKHATCPVVVIKAGSGKVIRAIETP